MKRIICAVLAFVMAMTLFGCTDDASGNSNPASSKNSASKVSSGTQTSSDVTSQTVVPITLNTKDGAVFCLVKSEVKEYIDKAKGYDLDDFSSSVVKEYLYDGIRAEPIYLSWECAEEATVTDVSVLLSRSEDMSDAVRYSAEQNSIEIYNLLTGATYYWCVEGNTSDSLYRTEVRSLKTEDTPRMIFLSKVGNTRDIGGWKDKNGNAMRLGLAYRGKALTDITDEGIAAAKLLGIRTQLDLRSISEFRLGLVDGKSVLGESVQPINVNGAQYQSFLNTKTAADELRVFADWSNYPIYFHCAAGADRTGSLTYVLQGLCGVEEVSMIMDYELTVYRDRTHKEFAGFAKSIRAMKGDTIQEKLYNHYHKKYGMTHMELSNIYNIFMTDSAVFASNSLTAGRREGSVVSFDLDLRKSGGVSSVKINGADVSWSMQGSTLVINGGSGDGVITLKDGAELKFSL